MHKQILRACCFVMTMGLTLGFLLYAQDPPTNKAGDLRTKKSLRDRASDFWIYDDMQAAYAAAKKTGKPILVYFR